LENNTLLNIEKNITNILPEILAISRFYVSVANPKTKIQWTRKYHNLNPKLKQTLMSSGRWTTENTNYSFVTLEDANDDKFSSLT